MAKNRQDGGEAFTDNELSLEDPETLRDRNDVEVTSVVEKHKSPDHCGTDSEGDVVVAVRNDDGELLLMRNDDLGIAVLPHGTVDAGQDWARAAREEIEALTGVSIDLTGIELLRDVDHVVEGQAGPQPSTYRVVFTGRAVGGEIHDCKKSPAAGSDEWWTCWADGLPAEASVPPGGPGDDLRYALE